MADSPGTSPSSTASSSGADPESARLSRPTLMYMLKRVLAEFTRDGGTDQAAKLTYFLVLSIAPTLLALFSLATLVLAPIKDEIATLVTDAVSSAMSGSSAGMEEAVGGTIEALLGSATGGTIALVIGIATALWSASAYIKAFGRVANHIYEVPEGRGFLRLTLSMLALTAAMIVGILIILISFLLSESIVDGLLGPIASTIGAGGLLEFLTGTFLPIWAWVKWPVVLLAAFALISLLYWAAPNVKKPFRLISPGGVVAIVGIAVAAVAVSVYMSTVAGYSSYGAIGGIMAVLFALWIMNIVILIGAEVDAEFERARELEAGKPAEGSVDLPLRDSTAAEKAAEKREALVGEGRDIRLRNLHRDGSTHTSEDYRLTPKDRDGATAGEGERAERDRGTDA